MVTLTDILQEQWKQTPDSSFWFAKACLWISLGASI
jgi:hypothetical protein